MSKLIRIGTPGNTLALSQANTIAELIKPSGYTTQLVTLDAKGKNGSSLEGALLDSKVDVVSIHAGFVPARLNDVLELIAFTERGIVNDVLIGRKKVSLATPGIKIATNSPRRIAFLKHFYPAVKVVAVPSDISSRIKKMEAGEYALLMNHADAERLELKNRIVETLETSYFVPSVGQGSIAVVCHKKLSFDRKEILQRWINHEETEDCIRTERSFLKTFQPDENIPVFGYARYEGNLITLKGGVISKNGKEVIKTKRSSTLAECKELGKKVAQEILINGGTRLLR